VLWLLTRAQTPQCKAGGRISCHPVGPVLPRHPLDHGKDIMPSDVQGAPGAGAGGAKAGWGCGAGGQRENLIEAR
jgi:hypothetical protein